MRRLKELLGLIPRLLIIGVELFAMYSFYMVFETMLPKGNEFAQFGVIEKILYLTFEETYKIAVLIFGAYIFSIIAIVISWIFNFATEFDDYDYFFDRFRVIPYAPIALILRTLKHIKLTVVFFFETLFDADLSGPYPKKVTPTRVTGGDEQKTVTYQELEKIMKKAVYHIQPQYSGFGVGIEWESGHLECSYFFFTFTFKGKIVCYYDEACPFSDYEMSKCINETINEIRSVANQVISEYCPKDAGSFKYKYDISFRID